MGGYWEGYMEAEAEAKTVVMDAIAMIRTGRLDDGVARLEREFFPTWEDVTECEARYREVMGRQ